jgi:hypothetical protein
MSTDWDSQNADELIGRYDELRLKQSVEIARLTAERDRAVAAIQAVTALCEQYPSGFVASTAVLIELRRATGPQDNGDSDG